MNAIIDFIFNPRTILVLGGLITTCASLIISLSKKGKTPKWLLWFTFVGGILVIIGGFKADVDQEKSTETIIQKTETITDLSTEIIELTKENVKQSKQISNTISGGDSFCYMHFGPIRDGITRHLIHQGKYPVYNVSLRILDLNKFNILIQKKELTLEKLAEIEEYYYYEIILPGKGIQLTNLTNPQNMDSLNYNIFFSARNNDWVQETRIRRVKGKWKFASRVNGMGKVLLLDIGKDFPLNNNKVSW